MPDRYMTAAEARQFLPSDTPLNNGEIEDHIDDAQEIAETITGDHFLPETLARVFDGTGEGMLPLDFPILSVSGFEILRGIDPDGWEEQGTAGLRIMGSGLGLALGNLTQFSRSVTRGRDLDRVLHSANVLDCGVFPAGTQNIRITGSWGRWQTVPRQIKLAMGLMIQHAASCIGTGERGVPSAAFSAESVPGGRSYTMRQLRTNALKDGLTGLADVDSILLRFTPATALVMTVL